jgi:hypothetical protein
MFHITSPEGPSGGASSPYRLGQGNLVDDDGSKIEASEIIKVN